MINQVSPGGNKPAKQAYGLNSQKSKLANQPLENNLSRKKKTFKKKKKKDLKADHLIFYGDVRKMVAKP